MGSMCVRESATLLSKLCGDINIPTELCVIYFSNYACCKNRFDNDLVDGYIAKNTKIKIDVN